MIDQFEGSNARAHLTVGALTNANKMFSSGLILTVSMMLFIDCSWYDALFVDDAYTICMLPAFYGYSTNVRYTRR